MPSSASSHPAGQSLPAVKLPCYVFEAAADLARSAAQAVETTIRQCNAAGRSAVLALPTGSTPLGVYRELIRLHREGKLDFSRVTTFNLDEYYDLRGDQLQSYRRWMHEHFFRHVNVPAENIFIPDGALRLDKVEAHCRWYEEKIRAAGGIDLALLGVGLNGHIAFNEPFSHRQSRTRLCTLDPITRRAAASDFFGEANVPVQAITMGLGTILDARKILLLALGEHKASIVRELAEHEPTERVPASLLQHHDDAALLADSAAASQLTARATPWVAGDVEWSDQLVKRAVLWLCTQSGKALLKLDDDDFRLHNLHRLLRHRGPAQKLAHRVFRWMSDTIEYHPAGKMSKRIICFSPHPDDDVISMGGTLIRLAEDGHETHVAYMTSGNIAVFDHDARRIADMVAEFQRLFGFDASDAQRVDDEVRRSLCGKKPGDRDIDTVLKIKGLIRRSEAKAAATTVGCDEQRLHFLDLPFYRTGAIAKKPVGDDDVQAIRALIDEIAPQQIYVAGDLSDPHGTHRMCAEAIFLALAEIERAGRPLPDVLLYRGAWQEYELHEIDIAVPLSPSDMELKRQAIFMHESQKDEALFPGADPREFWQRADDRNKNTADKYNQIGLPEYFAMEAFVRWTGEAI